MKIVTFGGIVMRLNPEGYLRLGQAVRNEVRRFGVDTTDIVWGGPRLGLYFVDWETICSEERGDLSVLPTVDEAVAWAKDLIAKIDAAKGETAKKGPRPAASSCSRPDNRSRRRPYAPFPGR